MAGLVKYNKLWASKSHKCCLVELSLTGNLISFVIQCKLVLGNITMKSKFHALEASVGSLKASQM